MSKDNRTIALTCLEAIGRFDLAALDTLLAPDAKYWVAGQPRDQLFSRQEVLGALGHIKDAIFDGPIKYTIHGVTVEGNRVAIEATSEARLRNGKDFRNTYHFLFEVTDGKVTLGREYADTKVLDQLGAG
jgi:ketosteroid isomerase-like protein